MKLVSLVNKYSFYYGFRGEFYQQVFGLAMGAPLSPILANLFLDSIEMSAIQCFRLSPCFWGRFMDDVLCFWEHGLDSLNLFFDQINRFDKNIKFTLGLEKQDMPPFLDILLIKNDNGLLFSIYRKPTHNDRYLYFRSSHPISVNKKNNHIIS
jgi:hypothetical protein